MITSPMNKRGVCAGEKGKAQSPQRQSSGELRRITSCTDQAISVCFAPIVTLKSACDADFPSFTANSSLIRPMKPCAEVNVA
jgi:hypothetical protein